MAFEGDVVVTPILPEGKRWTLVAPFRYHGNQDSFDVPAGFTTDFASVPRIFVWLLPRYGRWTQAAVLHDYLWLLAHRGELSKYDADGIFLRALRELEVPFLRRWIMWTAVRWAAGPTTWFERGPVPVLKMLAVSLPTLVVVTAPAVVILAALLVGAVAEFVLYGILRVFHRNTHKQVNAPDAGEVLST